jgi:hypothetical protein
MAETAGLRNGSGPGAVAGKKRTDIRNCEKNERRGKAGAV